MTRRFHGSPSILLYGLGGLCFSQNERTPGQRLAVLLAGPGAGFVLLAIVLAVTSLTFGVAMQEHLEVILTQVGLSQHPENLIAVAGKISSYPVRVIYWNMVWINLWWGLVNLLPIYPLDGGQATQVVLTQVDRREGVRRRPYCLPPDRRDPGRRIFRARPGRILSSDIFCGILALINFQVLQSLHQAQSFGVYQEDEWWRR